MVTAFSFYLVCEKIVAQEQITQKVKTKSDLVQNRTYPGFYICSHFHRDSGLELIETVIVRHYSTGIKMPKLLYSSLMADFSFRQAYRVTDEDSISETAV